MKHLTRWCVLLVLVVLCSLPAIVLAQQTPLQQAQTIKADLQALLVKVDALIAALTTAPPPVNTAPTVNAGIDFPITLPNPAPLNGTASDDGLPVGSVLTTLWSKVSGPGTVTFAAASQKQTVAIFSAAGSYVLRLTASDGALSSADDLVVTVNTAQSSGLSYLGKLRDMVSSNEITGPDGQLDATFRLALTATKPLASLNLARTIGGEWDTVPGNGTWCLVLAISNTAPPLNASNCTISYTPNGSALLFYASDFSNQYFVAGSVFAATATYTDGTTERVTTTIVGGPSPPTLQLTANPLSVPLGSASTLAWTATNATACTATGAWSGSRQITGTQAVTPTVVGTSTYGMTCTGPGGSVSRSVDVQATSGQPSATITVNASVQHQTMVGWESPTIGTVLDYTSALPLMAALADAAVDDLGITAVSIGVGSGAEQPGNCEQQYIDRTITENVLINTCAYNSVNDNASPTVADLTKFQFTRVDYQIEKVVQPIRQRVLARGEHPYVLLRYVDFRSSPFEHWQDPQEYGEFMLVMFQHMNSKYGFVPDGIDVMNEPDLVPFWDGTQLGQVIAAAGARLAAAGYRPDFVVPSVTNQNNAIAHLDEIFAVSGAAQYVKGISWHGYGGTGASAAIGARATTLNLPVFMTEWWNTSNTYLALHQELKTSRASWWQLGIITGTNGYYDISSGQVVLRPKARFIRQYYKYVRPGARRIDATTTSATFDPVAFVNTDGRAVVVVKASAGGSFTIGNLPAGTYGIFYTTGPDGLTVTGSGTIAQQTIVAGQALTVTMPAVGAITVYDIALDTAAPAAPACVAPCALDPTVVEFTASLDDATVTSYQFDAVSTNPLGAIALTLNLGRPIPGAVAGCGAPPPCIQAPIASAVLGAALNTLYVATVTAIGAGGPGLPSATSNAFMRVP